MKTLVYGMGISGKSTAEHLKRKREDFVVYDDNKKSKKYTNWNQDLSGIKTIVASPGIPSTNTILKKAQNLNIPIHCDIGLASFEKKLPKIISVTGTAGKTTLVSLLVDVLNANGKKSIALGNYGLSPLDILKSNYEYWVIEVSSFQSKRLAFLKPNIGIYLNLSQNHLDWHETIEDYKICKGTIFKNQDADDLRIVNSDLEKKYIKGKAKEKEIKKNEFSNLRKDIHEDTLSTVGLCIKELNLNHEIAKQSIINFKTLMHRYQKITTNDGIHWINDSKATTPLATLTAIERTPVGSIVLMGGSDKDLDYKKTLKKIKNKKMKLIPFGGISHALHKEASKLSVDSSKPCNSLEKAIQKAKNNGKGKTILLSPGTASFDEFTGYAQRGMYFIEKIKGG
ncbi:hypothetical protein CL659_02375 [bacterium]|nr:hypothetical protein [bacterium]|tara:strand:- start:6492 stop:7682 length:1191 start_codon:yes stop_codon:yes gene_type:complete